MWAVSFSQFGSPDVLNITELPDPEAEPGGVMVRVAASTINPTDLMMRRGEQAHLMTGLTPPYIAGMEFSGIVESKGAGVVLAVGQPVIGVVNPRRSTGGAHAQRVGVPAASVAVLAPEVDPVAAATVPMNALTALLALERSGLQLGQSLFVTGGAGMLGGYVIQLAKWAGLTVLADGREADAALLRDLGADVVVPRGEGMTEAVRRLLPAGVDGLIDCALIGRKVSSLVADGGFAISPRRSHPIEDPRLRVHYVSGPDAFADAPRIDLISRLMDEGMLAPRVAEDGRIPFRQAQDAHRRAETGGERGRIVLTFED